jgi:hypothetical protein
LERKLFSTTIDVGIQKRFRIACVENDTKMNDVLEVLMNQYASGELEISAPKKQPE